MAAPLETVAFAWIRRWTYPGCLDSLPQALVQYNSFWSDRPWRTRPKRASGSEQTTSPPIHPSTQKGPPTSPTPPDSFALFSLLPAGNDLGLPAFDSYAVIRPESSRANERTIPSPEPGRLAIGGAGQGRRLFLDFAINPLMVYVRRTLWWLF